MFSYANHRGDRSALVNMAATTLAPRRKSVDWRAVAIAELILFAAWKFFGG